MGTAVCQNQGNWYKSCGIPSAVTFSEFSMLEVKKKKLGCNTQSKSSLQWWYYWCVITLWRWGRM